MLDQVVDATPKPRGRPAGQYPSKVFSFRLTGEQTVKVERLAAAMGMTISAYCQRVMERHISARKHSKKLLRHSIIAGTPSAPIRPSPGPARIGSRS